MCVFQKQLAELTGTLEEERQRARRLQNERDVQQATAMSHKEREKLLHGELQTERSKRRQTEMKVENEREKTAALERELMNKDVILDKLQLSENERSRRETEKVNRDTVATRIWVTGNIDIVKQTVMSAPSLV